MIKLMLNVLFAYPLFVDGQNLIGSSRDEHGCVSDGGYQWCESAGACIRPWLTECTTVSAPAPVPAPAPVSAPAPAPVPALVDENGFCHDSPMQLCRMMCRKPDCKSGQCAMRQGSCCSFTCMDTGSHLQHPTDPLPPTLPHPTSNNIPRNCLSWFDGCNTCSVVNGRVGGCTLMMCFRQGTPECRAYVPNSNNCVSDSDCDSNHFCRPTLNVLDSPKTCTSYSQKDETCGGMTLSNRQSRCHPTLECVNTMGPMIADAPGRCLEHCPHTGQHRDQYGNCIDTNCRSWFDGCNTCQIGSNGQLACTEMYCRSPSRNAHCQSVSNQHTLNIGDTCYRFCEDSSELTVSMRDKCPTGSTCSSQSTSMVSFDTCGPRAHVCMPVAH